MNVILFDGESHQNLLPLTYTRPVANLRIGILTINEKWEKALNSSVSYATQDYLSTKFPIQKSEDNLLINGGLCPDGKIELAIQNLNTNEVLVKEGKTVAARMDAAGLDHFLENNQFSDSGNTEYADTILLVEYSWDIFSKNGEALELDFDVLTKGRTSAVLSDSNTLIGDRLFVEEGAGVEGAIINTKSG